MAHELRVAVIDDDVWKRNSMSDQLDGHEHVAVVHAIDQDEAARWEPWRWAEVDAILVDVYDDRAPGELGTDLYSGVMAIERVPSREVRVVAVVPQSPHPLVELRVFQARPGWVYHRHEIPTLDELVGALLDPDKAHRPSSPDAHDLRRLGAVNLRANRAVRAYLESPLYARLLPGVGHKGLGLSRRTVDRFKRQIHAAGFTGTENLSVPDKLPRWPDIRDVVLRLLGRLEAPPSDFDKPWWLA